MLVITVIMVGLTACTTYGPLTATSNSPNEKLGTACNSWILAPIPPFTWGRNDIRAAATLGKIEKIGIVDYETHWYLIYGQTCTNVYGQ